MKKLGLGLVALAVAMPAFSQGQVRGYTRRDGTYVAPHVRSAPNDSRLDNYSTRGNVNPYTGKQGTVDPYARPTYPRVEPRAPAYTSYTPPKSPCYFNCPK